MRYDRCIWCNEIIDDDEQCVEFNGLYHKDCFEEAAPIILMDMYGAKKKYLDERDDDIL